MLTKPFKPLALAFLVNLIISVEDKIKYNIAVAERMIIPYDPKVSIHIAGSKCSGDG